MNKYTLKKLMKEFSDINDKSNPDEVKLHQYVKNLDGVSLLEESDGYILFNFLDKKVALLYDEGHNRMRIISPITEYSTLAPKIKDALMQANFHLALDARYAVTEDTLYSAFMHPLSSLKSDDFKSALTQVCNLSINFAKTYSAAQIEFTKKK